MKLGGMVDISSKEYVYREARAEGIIKLSKDTLERIKSNNVEKGDVIEAAKITAINAVKNTPSILPYCHPIKITDVKVDYEYIENGIKMGVTVKAIEQTGVEMEALTGVINGLLCIWDMVKKYEKDYRGLYPNVKICDVKVVYKKKSR